MIICWAGKQINSALKDAWEYVWYDVQWERIIKTQNAEAIVRATLKKTRDTLQNSFYNQGNITVTWSWVEVGWVYCHINADTLVFTYYLWFDTIYVFTFRWNKEKKKEIFKWYKKVEIIEL